MMTAANTIRLSAAQEAMSIRVLHAEIPAETMADVRATDISRRWELAFQQRRLRKLGDVATLDFCDRASPEHW